MSAFLDEMIEDYQKIFFADGSNISILKKDFLNKYIKNRKKLLGELQKEINIYAKDMSNQEKINKLKDLFWQIQSNEIIILGFDKIKPNCMYGNKCYQIGIEHSTEFKHPNNSADNLATKIAMFLDSLDNRIKFKNSQGQKQNKKRYLRASQTQQPKKKKKFTSKKKGGKKSYKYKTKKNKNKKTKTKNLNKYLK